MKYEGLKIIGYHGICEGELIEFNIPDDFFIQGFITNFGDLYCVKEKSNAYPMLPGREFYTKKELKIKINVLRRKQKLKKLHESR